MYIRNKLNEFYRQFISLRGEPRLIALGLAMGIGVGVTPTIPFHTAIIILLGVLFRQNITAAYLGSWLISNPITIPFLYVGEYEIGRNLLGMQPASLMLEEYSISRIAALGWEILLPLLVGGLILAPIIALPAYFIAHRFLDRAGQRRIR